MTTKIKMLKYVNYDDRNKTVIECLDYSCMYNYDNKCYFIRISIDKNGKCKTRRARYRDYRGF